MATGQYFNKNKDKKYFIERGEQLEFIKEFPREDVLSIDAIKKCMDDASLYSDKQYADNAFLQCISSSASDPFRYFKGF